MQRIGYATLIGPHGAVCSGALIRYFHWVDSNPWHFSRYVESDCLRLEIIGHPEHAKQSRYDPDLFFFLALANSVFEGWSRIEINTLMTHYPIV
jgi:hypothetical protein